jgi:polysaccharide lyase-like protein
MRHHTRHLIPIRTARIVARYLCRTSFGFVLADTKLLRRLPAEQKECWRTFLNIVNFEENFAGGGWSWAWGEELRFPYSARVVSDPVDGHANLRFEWRLVDFDGSRSTMSAEMLTGHFRPRDSLSYAYRFFLPSECRDFAVPLILSQTHDMPDFHLGETWKHPISEVRLQGGVLYNTYRGSREAVTPVGLDGKHIYTTKQDLQLGQPYFDRWNNIGVHEQLCPVGQGGCVRIRLNIAEWRKDGIHIGYNDEVGPFWKFGVYLPISEGAPAPNRVVVFFDRVRVGTVRLKGKLYWNENNAMNTD